MPIRMSSVRLMRDNLICISSASLKPSIVTTLSLPLIYMATPGIYKKDPSSFLFSLVNPNGLKPTKVALIPEKEEYAIYCSSSNFPIFGNSNSGYFDLSLGSSPTSSNNCSSNLNNSYRCPEGQSYLTFLAGNYAFYASEIGVFAFEK